mmetsp:Transcript_18293/g.64789  ORF Transcript_18293/g.64789 Transcript_18293/m.64789 type:complete len:225 (-) Transcript_18293:2529-3203(-)
MASHHAIRPRRLGAPPRRQMRHFHPLRRRPQRTPARRHLSLQTPQTRRIHLRNTDASPCLRWRTHGSRAARWQQWRRLQRARTEATSLRDHLTGRRRVQPTSRRRPLAREPRTSPSRPLALLRQPATHHQTRRRGCWSPQGSSSTALARMARPPPQSPRASRWWPPHQASRARAQTQRGGLRQAHLRPLSRPRRCLHCDCCRRCRRTPQHPRHRQRPRRHPSGT